MHVKWNIQTQNRIKTLDIPGYQKFDVSWTIKRKETLYQNFSNT